MTDAKPKSQRERNAVLFPYVGSKWRLSDRIIGLLPDHTHFVDLFGGSGAVTLRKPPSKIESFNDNDSDIYNLFRCCLDGKFFELRERVVNTPTRSQQFYADALAVMKRPMAEVPDVLAAWAFLLVAHTGMPRHPRLKKPSDWLPNITSWRSRWSDLPKTLDLVRRRFANVQLLHEDWTAVVDRMDRSSTAFYIDPPYPTKVLSAKRKLYVHELPEMEQHEAMLTRLLALKGYAILSGYTCPLYEQMLAHWRRVEVGTYTNMGIAERASARTEVLWLNYDKNGRRL